MVTGAPNYGSSKSADEDFLADITGNLLPRAVTRHTSFQLLDGEWKFAIDTHDVGLKEEWFKDHQYEHTAEWPGSIEEHMLTLKSDTNSGTWSDKVVAWYEREFTLPKRDADIRKSVWQLTFGACGYETRVWINGILLTTIEGEDVHFGEYTSFSYELIEEHIKPVNRITVRIQDTMDADIPRGKQESHVYKRGGIWYHTYTGAVRSIWLETVERNRLRSRLGVVSIVEDNLVRFNLTTRIHDPGKYTIRLKVFTTGKGERKLLAIDDFPIELKAGQKQQRIVLEVPEAKMWSPDSPYLYRLVAQLIDKDGYTGEIETKFGMRKIEARGCCVYLNNEAVYIDGILYQPATASFDQIRSHMIAMKKLGCNLVRIHIAGVDPRIYNLADKMGMMLWVEVPSPHSSNEKSRKNHFDELKRMLALIETHPSVVIWSLYNEDWGAQDIETNEETRKYITDTYHYMHINHPQFLVVDNDGWQHISLEGRLKSDLYTVHLYTAEVEKWKQMLNDIVKGKMVGVAAFPLVVGDPFFFNRQVPIIVSEWGGFGFADYGGPKDSENRAELIGAFKTELRNRQIAGDVYTQATNIEDEKNGLIDFETGELKVPENLLFSRDSK